MNHDVNTDSGFAAAVAEAAAKSREGATTATEATAPSDPERDSAASITAGLQSPKSSSLNVQDALRVDGDKPQEEVNSQGMTKAEVERVLEEGRRISAEYRADPRRQAEANALTELALRDARHAFENAETDEHEIAAWAALKNVNAQAFDREMERIHAEEVADLTWEERAEIEDGEVTPEEAGIIDVDRIRDEVETQIAQDKVRAALVGQIETLAQMEQLWGEAYTDSVVQAAKELGLSQDRMEARVAEALDAGLLNEPPESPSAIVGQLKYAVATLEEIENETRKARAQEAIMASFASDDMANGYTYGNERDVLVAGPDGRNRWVPESQAARQRVPVKVSEERIRERANSRSERGMSGAEIAAEIGKPNERDVLGGLTAGADNRPVTIDEADGTARRYREKQADIARRAGSNLEGAGWTT